MRFAWLAKNPDNNGSIDSRSSNRLILMAYNLLWWIPIVLVVIGVFDFGTGFITFAVITIARALINAYRNNILETPQAIGFPLRSP